MRRSLATPGGLERTRVAKSGLLTGPCRSVDFDEIVAGAASNATAGKRASAPAHRLRQLSMPPQSLKKLIADTAKAGGVVVFRGFPNNSMKRFATSLEARSSTGKRFPPMSASTAPLPRVRRAGRADLCRGLVGLRPMRGFSCQTDVPPYDRLVGNVSVEYARSSSSPTTCIPVRGSRPSAFQHAQDGP